MTNLDSILKSRDITLSTKVHLQSYGFSSSHVWMWELDYKESWAWKNWCFSTVVLEKTLESPLDSKQIQSVHPKGNQSWIVIGRTDAEADTPILWPPDAKNWFIWKDPDAGKIEGGRRRGWQRMRWLDGISHSMGMSEWMKSLSHVQLFAALWTVAHQAPLSMGFSRQEYQSGLLFPWVWVNSRSWWWTGRPGMLQSTGLQRVGHDWATELNWTDY